MEKPFELDALKLLLERAAELNYVSQEKEGIQRHLACRGKLSDLVGSSAAMQDVLALIQQVAPTSAPVLITGESGTGKELVAETIHRLSPRRRGPFVALNCAALPETLMESELFGHEKGAFTGAAERRAGCFELAEGGTLLLDKIGEMPPDTQAKLLRVLEEGRVRRLGAKTEVAVDVRILAATNKVPEVAVSRGQLRPDLYYRLNVFHVSLPPLRERKEDLPQIVEDLLPTLNYKHSCRVSDLEPAALERLRQHDWPGNVRELRNVLERAVIVAGQGTVRSTHLAAEFCVPSGIKPPQPDCASITIPIGMTAAEAEWRLISKTLEYSRNNKSQAARILGLSLRTLHRKLKTSHLFGERITGTGERGTEALNDRELLHVLHRLGRTRRASSSI